jgi:hypothetical protein
MAQTTDTSGMEFVVLLFIVLVGPFAVAFGTDSRLDETARRRRWRGIV